MLISRSLTKSCLAGICVLVALVCSSAVMSENKAYLVTRTWNLAILNLDNLTVEKEITISVERGPSAFDLGMAEPVIFDFPNKRAFIGNSVGSTKEDGPVFKVALVNLDDGKGAPILMDEGTGERSLISDPGLFGYNADRQDFFADYPFWGDRLLQVDRSFNVSEYPVTAFAPYDGSPIYSGLQYNLKRNGELVEQDLERHTERSVLSKLLTSSAGQKNDFRMTNYEREAYILVSEGSGKSFLYHVSKTSEPWEVLSSSPYYYRIDSTTAIMAAGAKEFIGTLLTIRSQKAVNHIDRLHVFDSSTSPMTLRYRTDLLDAATLWNDPNPGSKILDPKPYVVPNSNLIVAVYLGSGNWTPQFKIAVYRLSPEFPNGELVQTFTFDGGFAGMGFTNE